MKIIHFPLFEEASGDAGAGGSGTGNGSGAGQGQGQGGGQGAVFDIRQHVDDAGGFKPGWAKAIGVPDALEQKFARPDALARSYASLEKQIGAKGIIVPGPNATQAERDAFLKQMGRPDKPEGYEFKKPDKIGERLVPDTAWSADRAAAWQQKLYEFGVPKDTAQKIMQAAIEESLTAGDMIEKGMKDAQAQAKADLQKEWGADYDKHMGEALRAAQQFSGDDLVKHPGWGNDPTLIRFLAKVGAATGEQPGKGIRESGGQNQLTAAEAAQRARELTATIAKNTKADRNWATSQEAQAMKDEKRRMFEMAFPGS